MATARFEKIWQYDLDGIVIPKEIRRICEGDPVHTTLTSFDFFIRGIVDFAERITGE